MFSVHWETRNIYIDKLLLAIRCSLHGFLAVASDNVMNNISCHGSACSAQHAARQALAQHLKHHQSKHILLALIMYYSSDWCAGVINGVQGSLQSLLQSLSYVAGLVLWRPTQFPSLMFASVVVVMCAASLYTIFVCLRRHK